jgi:hypothetical protein
METTVPGVYVAGDCAGIGEASTAMLEGELAAFSLLAKKRFEVREKIALVQRSLEKLRRGPFGERPRTGKEKVFTLMKEVAVG